MSAQTSSKSKTIKTPGPDHPITIERNPRRVASIGAYDAVAAIRNCLAFYSERVDAIEECSQ